MQSNQHPFRNTCLACMQEGWVGGGAEPFPHFPNSFQFNTSLHPIHLKCEGELPLWSEKDCMEGNWSWIPHFTPKALFKLLEVLSFAL